MNRPDDWTDVLSEMHRLAAQGLAELSEVPGTTPILRAEKAFHDITDFALALKLLDRELFTILDLTPTWADDIDMRDEGQC